MLEKVRRIMTWNGRTMGALDRFLLYRVEPAACSIIAATPSFGMRACRNRKVTMSALIDPVVNLDFYQITNRGSRLSEGAQEFSGFLKTYIANWAGTSSI